MNVVNVDNSISGTDTIWATLAETGRVRVAIPGTKSQFILQGVLDQLHGEALNEGVSLRINKIFKAPMMDTVDALDVALRKHVTIT